MYRKFLKPLIDFFTALVLLLLAAPVLLLSGLLLFVANDGKVFFIQPRPGKREKIFKLIKFKTMTDEKDETGLLLPDEQRLTPVGKFVRKTSIDELPQLINILKGDMSLIGPRPWLEEYLPLYNDYQRKRHQVKPGITGWAQVNGRNLLDWKRRFDYDIYYVDHLSFWLDLKIMMLTIWNILHARGISGEGSVTMEKFTGNEKTEGLR